MRLGFYSDQLKKSSKAHQAYGEINIAERHRHRYEFNNRYRRLFEKNGLVVTGLYPSRGLAEIVELKGHPWFVVCQFHPEFKSKPDKPHPLFRAFIGTALSCTAKT